MAFVSVQACAYVTSVYERLLRTGSATEQAELLGRCSAVLSVHTPPPVGADGSGGGRPEIMAVAHIDFAYADEAHQAGSYTVFRLW